jgi:hypothetical protein
MQGDQKTASNGRIKILLIFTGLVLLWAFAGTATWSGQLKHLYENNSAAKGAILFVGITTWPAHEGLLEYSGKGFGYNAPAEFDYISFLFFLAWAVILWSPILFLLKKNFSLWLTVAIQAILIIIVSATFWKFGTG